MSSRLVFPVGGSHFYFLLSAFRRAVFRPLSSVFRLPPSVLRPPPSAFRPLFPLPRISRFSSLYPPYFRFPISAFQFSAFQLVVRGPVVSWSRGLAAPISALCFPPGPRSPFSPCRAVAPRRRVSAFDSCSPLPAPSSHLPSSVHRPPPSVHRLPSSVHRPPSSVLCLPSSVLRLPSSVVVPWSVVSWSLIPVLRPQWSRGPWSRGPSSPSSVFRISAFQRFPQSPPISRLESLRVVSG